ncbi:uncharacterized protein BXZ73DRAFT_43159, partial [Epithele typhae]|uniref:uncharacterized protein n=1 Tax=Epithele typhae TaxID=378194 RepID=UPI00200864DC
MPPAYNEIFLNRPLLLSLLTMLSDEIRRTKAFCGPVLLVTHGGAPLVLEGLRDARQWTRDVNIVVYGPHFSYVEAFDLLKACITRVAQLASQYGIGAVGADWMNADDAALRGRRDPYGDRLLVDHIYTATTSPGNRAFNSLFSTAHLLLIAVPRAWALALKIERFRKDDPADAVVLLRKLAPEGRTAADVERELERACWAIGWGDAETEMGRQKDRLR